MNVTSFWLKKVVVIKQRAFELCDAGKRIAATGDNLGAK